MQQLTTEDAFNAPRNNRLVVLGKEYMDLTKDPLIAIVLNQLVYWSCRVNDYADYIQEEKENKTNPQHGWIYKSSDELIEETLIGVDRSTMCRYINFLVDNEWIMRRSNPHNQWDKTPQYRVNLQKLEADLLTLGDPLPAKKNPTGQNATSTLQNAHSTLHFAHSTLQNATSYTYTETTNKDDKQKEEARARIEKMTEVWKAHMPYDKFALTETRIEQMDALLNREFHNDLEEWVRFCSRITDCPFLMGQGARGWRIRMDWLLFPDHFQKVQEGHYEEYQRSMMVYLDKPQHPKVAEILESIKDSKWKEWCTKMAQGQQLLNGQMIERRLSVNDLEIIKDAWFIEYDEDFLVWVGSHDQAVLNKIEDLRMRINWVFKSDYFEGRTFRTRLIAR